MLLATKLTSIRFAAHAPKLGTTRKHRWSAAASSVLFLCGMAATIPVVNGSNPVAYNRSDGASSVVYRGADNHMHELYLIGGAWHSQDPTFVAGAALTASDPAVYVRWDNLNTIVYRGSDNHIHELTTPGGGRWQTGDLSALANAAPAVGNPAAYRRSDGYNSVVYRGPDNDIHELYLGATGRWATGDLTVLAGAPQAADDPVAYRRADGVNSIVYRGTDNDIHELYLTGGTWRNRDPSASTGSGPSTGVPAVYVRSDNRSTIVYRGSDAHAHELSTAGGLFWQAGDLSALSGAPFSAGNPMGYRRQDNVNSVVYRGLDSHIHELYLTYSSTGYGSWGTADLSAMTGGWTAAGDPFGYARTDGVNSVVYRGFDGHVYELYLTPNASAWRIADLTSITGAPLARTFNFQAFADNLEKNLAGNVVGYSFSVSYLDQWNNMRAGGLARIDADAPSFGMNPEVKFSIASMSKTITAAAALKLLAPRGDSGMLDNAIGPYLPPEFGADTAFQAITFRQLLDHKSGIGVMSNPPDVDYPSIMSWIGSHPNVSDKTRKYSNTNYALFRFMIPKLAGIHVQSNDPGLEYANEYAQYVQQNVFNPLGLGLVDQFSDTSTGMSYMFPIPTSPNYHGLDLHDLTRRNASEGWVMSTQGLAHFLRDLHFSENVLGMAASTQMMNGTPDNCLGYDFCGQPVADGSATVYAVKAGSYPGCWNGLQFNPGEFQGRLVVFSNGVSLALIVNSNLSSGPFKLSGCPNGMFPGYGDEEPMNAVLDAFNAAGGS